MSDLLASLQEFHRDTLAMLLRHEESAKRVTQYDVNNTYQYIVNREETHLAWVASAIAEQGGVVVEQVGQVGQVHPGRRAPSGTGTDASRQMIEEDARDSQAFVDRWRPRLAGLTNARHAKMLGLVLGEVLEQKRFFEQALAGRTDLLGRRAQQSGPAVGKVLSSRWIE